MLSNDERRKINSKQYEEPPISEEPEEYLAQLQYESFPRFLKVNKEIKNF